LKVKSFFDLMQGKVTSLDDLIHTLADEVALAIPL
jgi:hypothetical protein